MTLKFFTALTKKAPDRQGPRRRSNRIARYFDCTWMSPWGEQNGRISSLSVSGCYIDGRTVPGAGADVPDIRVMLPTGAITVQGTVVDATPGIGFAVRFTELDTDAHARLSDLVRP